MEFNFDMQALVPLFTDWGIKIVLALLIYIVGKWIAKRITGFIGKIMQRADMDETLVTFLSNLVYAILLAAVILAALDKLGVPVTSLLAILGAAGLAIGLALKDSLGNFAAGVMLLAGINFSLHYQLLKGRPLAFWKDSECRFYLAMCLILTVVVGVNIYRTVYADAGQAVRYAAFQVVSIVTTTGYATADYELWPPMSQIIIFLCMFVGASAGSTGGGMKCLRIMLCFKYCYRELFSLIHPHAVSQIKIGGKAVPDDVMRSVVGFLALYMGLFALSAVILAGLGVDFRTSFAAVAASIGNIGPGFGMVGPVENYAHIPYLGKWLLIWFLLLGLMEIFTVIILVVPEFYRK